MAEQSLAQKIADAVDVMIDTDPLKFRDVVMAVLGLHYRSVFAASQGEPRGKHYCMNCTSLDEECADYVLYPCPTVEAVAKALGVSVDG